MAFVTDDFFETLYCVLSTKEQFEDYQKKNPDYTTYKGQEWATYEWLYGDSNVENSPFGNKFYPILSKLSSELALPYDMHDENKQAFIAAFIDAITEGVLAIPDEVFTSNQQNKETITFFISISDNDYAETIENESAKRMNHQELANHFIQRFN
ncbi:DUF4303 domain-containing protein [Isobaculum melis]|uniref:DUF4303 domain-containing protein n=1 Tax=Isobaculum melis TaxID=142588 RepID=A0A1H9SZ43_9LACT|nr:DUF4303 domain-containing protein [Isobaculum melis]SER90225.1 protein of unknown function [Isobaculum melis]